MGRDGDSRDDAHKTEAVAEGETTAGSTAEATAEATAETTAGSTVETAATSSPGEGTDVEERADSGEALRVAGDTSAQSVGPINGEGPGSDLQEQTSVPDGQSQQGEPELDQTRLGAALEAILFVVEAPVTITSLASAVRMPIEAIEAALAELAMRYDETNAGVELRHVAGGVRLYTRPEFSTQVEQFLVDGQRSRLTQAALETLAVIAYRQPVTRARVSAIRGVNVDGVVRTLTARGLILEVGTDAETGGGLYRTTELFLEKMGLQSLDDLPSLAPLLPELDGLDIESP